MNDWTAHAWATAVSLVPLRTAMVTPSLGKIYNPISELLAIGEEARY